MAVHVIMYTNAKNQVTVVHHDSVLFRYNWFPHRETLLKISVSSQLELTVNTGFST